MIKRKPYLPVTIITGVILFRAVVFDQNYQRLNKHVVSVILYGIIFSPLIAITASLVAFFLTAFLLKRKKREILKEYLSLSFEWAVLGIGIAFVIIVVLTAIYNSPQGPLGFIIDGPLGLSTGILVGAGLWVKQEYQQKSVQ